MPLMSSRARSSLETGRKSSTSAAKPEYLAFFRSARLSKPIIGHGIFIEGNPIGTLSRYQGYKTAPSMLERLMSMLPDALRPSPDPVALIGKFVEAMNDMAVKSVWLQLFNRRGEIDRDGKGATAQLVGALKSAGIAPVGWGYCYNKNATTDLALTVM